MDLNLSEEQLASQNTARMFSEKEIAPHASKWNEECFFPIETLRKAAKLDFAGIYVSPDFAGCALGRLEASLILRSTKLSAMCATCGFIKPLKEQMKLCV